jgi:hypothetical protein
MKDKTVASVAQTRLTLTLLPLSPRPQGAVKEDLG